VQESEISLFFRVEVGVWGIYILYCKWWRWGGKWCHICYNLCWSSRTCACYLFCWHCFL